MSEENSEYDISRYDYTLPPERIAQRPAEERDASRLMVVHRADGRIEHAVFRELGRFLRAGDLLVLNDTRVFPARTVGMRSTGGKVEVLFLRDLGQGLWEAMIRAHGKPKSGEYLQLEQGRLIVKLAQKTPSGQWTVVVPRQVDLAKALQEVGRTPLPPYVRRGEDWSLEEDRERYQTVYARQTGAVAAPTAGLHFTEELLRALRERGIGTAEITLHVGLGTFQPIKVDDIRRHRMHAESFSIGAEAAVRIAETKRAGGRVVAVGTTSCRALETAAASPRGFGPFHQGESRLYIYPPYAFKMTDALLTNFHLPRSTLLLLVAAFGGRERILGAYEEAARVGYRFYSYGDAMLIL
jgi:S-adenosylmethionine:tRNA ribosyltransferase-isomerase